MSQLAVFDICGTLYYSNTTYDFMLFYFNRNNQKKYKRFKLCLSIPAKVLWKTVSLLGFQKNIRRYLIGYLKNEPSAKVVEEAKVFVAEILATKKIEEVQDALRFYKERNAEIILASASLYPVVQAIAESLGISTFMATILESENGKYTGKIETDLEGGKHHKIATFAQENSVTACTVYSDNKEDLELLQLADQAFVISFPKNETFWKSSSLDLEKTKIILK